MRSKRVGLTLIEILVVILIIELLASLAVPNILKVRNSTYKNICINNLRHIEAAKYRWGLDTNQPDTAEPEAADLDPYIKKATAKLICPADPNKSFGASYKINTLYNSPRCKIDPGSHKL